MIRKMRFVLPVLAVLAWLAAAASARADGITFGFIGGNIYAHRPIGGVNPPYVTNDPAVTAAIPKSSITRIHYVTRFSGDTAPGVPGPPTLGVTTFPNVFNFGKILFKTGSLLSTTGTTLADFNAGGYIHIIANSGMALATGGVVPNGNLMFSGFFSDVTTFAQTNSPLSLSAYITLKCGAKPTKTCTNNNTTGYNNTYLPNFNYQFSLSGPVSGTLSSAVLNYFHLGKSPGADGMLGTIAVGFLGPGSTTTVKGSIGNAEGGTESAVVPEPGSISLLGTGLSALFALIVRRKTARS